MKITQIFFVSAACCLAFICLVSCGSKVESEPTKVKPVSTNAENGSAVLRVAARANPSPETSTATVAMTTCSRCNGAGKVLCGARDCKDGFKECPGECLKKSKGVWEHLKVAGHGDEELWQKIYARDGHHWTGFTQAHCGEVIVIGEDAVTSGGACPQCSGSTQVKCSICEGAAEMVCPACNGKKVLPENWVAPAVAKPKIITKPIRLTNGQTIMGKIEMQFGNKVFIRMEDGKQLEKDASEIMAEPGK